MGVGDLNTFKPVAGSGPSSANRTHSRFTIHIRMERTEDGGSHGSLGIASVRVRDLQSAPAVNSVARDGDLGCRIVQIARYAGEGSYRVLGSVPVHAAASERFAARRFSVTMVYVAVQYAFPVCLEGDSPVRFCAV